MNKQIKRKAVWLVAGAAAISLGVVSPAIAEPVAPDESQQADMAFMREEERLARDLYQAFADQYDGARPFSNIVRAEQKHFDEVGVLLERYGVADPSAEMTAGRYSYPELQELYDTWLARGSGSLAAAHQVGVELETRDIADLEEAMSGATADDVRATYERLQSGSERHLAAFERAASGQTGPMGDGNGARAGNQQGPRNGSGKGTGAGMQGQRAGGQQNHTGPRDGSGPLGGSGDCPYAG
ncbi:MAG: DUF2202 domain-containing protein [Nigerium sp.]|nr:DUF2202 domain-containing protein [Nigerium sp.]